MTTFDAAAPPSRARGWASPDLLAGRPATGILLATGAILIGSFADTIAFKSALDLLLRAAEWQSWVMAVGATLLALVAAAHLGMERAGLRRRDPDASALHVAACAVVWLFLGAALVYVRWTGHDAAAAGGFGLAATQEQLVHQAHASAFFFGALYLISGVGAALVAGRLTNPASLALRRSEAACEQQEATVARLRGELDRARNAVHHHHGESDRDLDRRDIARVARQALGAEAANYARVLMAQHMQDPRKTGVTETGPVLAADARDSVDGQPQPGRAA